MLPDSTPIATAFLYDRVSTAKQGAGYSLPTQRAACRQYAESRGYPVIAEFEDQFTGTEYIRPGLDELLDAITVQRPTVVIAYDVDRLLGRDGYGQAMIKEMLSRAGVRVEYVLGGDSTSDEGMMQEDFKALWAKHENRQRIERSRRGKNGRVQAGNVLMTGQRTPFGYDYISEPHKGWFVPNEAEAAVVRDMYSWIIDERLTSYAIARRLWERGILTAGDENKVVFKKAGKGEWSASTVRRILSNPLYKGEWYWGKTRKMKVAGTKKQVKTDPSEWIKVDVPAIVDADRWQLAQDFLAENKARSPRNTKREYLLRGMIFCPCGRRWCGRYRNNVDRAYYRCPTTESEYWRMACKARFSIRQDVLEPAVLKRVEDFIRDPETLLGDIERDRQAQAVETVRRDQRIRANTSAIADVDRKLSVLLDQALDGFPADVIAAKRRELVEHREDLDAERRRLDAERSTETITPGMEAMLRELSADMDEGFAALTFAGKRRLLEVLRIRVEVLDESHVRLSGVISDAIVALSSSCKRDNRPLEIPFTTTIDLMAA